MRTRAQLHRDIDAGKYDDCLLVPAQLIVTRLEEVEDGQRTAVQVVVELQRREVVYDLRMVSP